MKASRLFSLVAGLVLAALAVVVSPAAAQNLVQNPSFDSKLAGWDWWGGTNTIIQSGVYTAPYSLRVGTPSGGLGQTITAAEAVPGATYRLMAATRHSSASYPVHIGVRFLDGTGAQITQTWVESNSKSWTQRTRDVVAPAAAAGLMVWVWKNASSGYGYVDDISVTCVANCAAAPPPPPPPSSSPPPAGGYSDIDLLSPTATLPTVQQCLNRVRRSTWEPRTQNNDENYDTTPLILPSLPAFNDSAVPYYMDRLTAASNARITGTTDELIQFFSCYWGVDDESTRARARIESSWDQDVNGDANRCPDPGGISWGLLQPQDAYPRGCSSSYHPGTYPDIFVSTANNLNYALSWLAGCYRGDMSKWVPGEFMTDPPRRMRECIGLWFSGQWRSGNAGYLAAYDEAMATKPWLRSDFPSWNVGYVCREPACDTLPAQ